MTPLLSVNDLIAQQLPALRAVLPQLAGAAGETLAVIVAALADGHYPQAMRLINRFLTAQAALVVSEDADLTALRAEIATLQDDDTYTLLRGFADEAAYQAYLAEQCAILAGELEQLYTLLRTLTDVADDPGNATDTSDEEFFF